MSTAPFATTADLARDLRALGVPEGGVLMVHSSLSSLGRVLGGAPALVRALLAALAADWDGSLDRLANFLDGPAR